jgi:hypothetical protein
MPRNASQQGLQAAHSGGRPPALDAAAIGMAAWALAFFLAAPSMSMFTPATIFSLRSGDFVHNIR